MTALTKIDEQGCGCGAADHVSGLITIDEAIAGIVRNTHEVPETERVTLAAAWGRILAEPVRSISAAPPFDNAAMDGYAINSACLTGDGPWILPMSNRIAVGQGSGWCHLIPSDVEILPEGALEGALVEFQPFCD